ncbi:MAG: hypothetical protein EBX69_08165, partial [Betaproteobacteria bacterium]|nr:hypothetical protein [Betaproteobacteria bacterium]
RNASDKARPRKISMAQYLVYCAIEILRGRALSEALRLRLQQLGLTAILALTMIALWNDFSRFF